MIGDKSSALSSEIRIFFRNPANQNTKESESHQSKQAQRRQQGKQSQNQQSQKALFAPILPGQNFYPSQENSKDAEVFCEEDQSIDQFQDYTQIQSEYEQLKKWFESLSVQERVNCLTTTYPSLVSKLIEAHFEMRESGTLSLFKRHTSASHLYALQSQNSYSQSLGYGYGINVSAQNSYKQQIQSMYSRYDSKIQQHTSYGQKLQHQSGSKQYGSTNQTTINEFPLFELIKSEESQMRNLGSHNIRHIHDEFLKYIRITDYKQQFDTLTVSPQLVYDSGQFFSLMAEITNHKAFREPSIFKQKGSRVIIDSPQWTKKIEYTYLSVWIVITLEETLWAHYNFANQTNIERNVRGDALKNTFKERTETLQSQEDLAKRWSEIGNLGRKRLIEKLKLKAKETFEEFYGNIDSNSQLEDMQIIQEDAYNCTQLNMANFSGFQSEDLMSAFSQNQKSTYQNSSPYSQFYQFHKIPLRPSFARQYNDLFLSDPESAFVRMQNHDRDLQEILDFVQTDWAHITPLDIIKFLSETPIQEMDRDHRARKTFLSRELHSLIQEDLRQSIQNQLINENIISNKKNKEHASNPKEKDSASAYSNQMTNFSSGNANSTVGLQQSNTKKQKAQANSNSQQIDHQQKQKPKEKESPESNSGEYLLIQNKSSSPQTKPQVMQGTQRKKKGKNKNNQIKQQHTMQASEGTGKEIFNHFGQNEQKDIVSQTELSSNKTSALEKIQSSQKFEENQSTNTTTEVNFGFAAISAQEICKDIQLEQNQEAQKKQNQDSKQITALSSQQKGGNGNRKKRKGKTNMSQAKTITTEEPLKIEKIGTASSRQDSTEVCTDWQPRQIDSSPKNNSKISQRSPTFSSQIGEVTGLSTHSFDDEKFCSGTGPCSGDGIFSDDNIMQLEVDGKIATNGINKSKEILLLDCKEKDVKSNKTSSNFLSKSRSDIKASDLKNEKQQKRADSRDEKIQTEWNAFGSGLLKVNKNNNRELEPQQTLKKQLDFKLIFDDQIECFNAADTDIDSQPNSNPGIGSSSDTRQSTVSNKYDTHANKKMGQQQLKQQSQRLGKPSKQQFESGDSSSIHQKAKNKYQDQINESGTYANLNVLTASQSVDFISKKTQMSDSNNKSQSSHAKGTANTNEFRLMFNNNTILTPNINVQKQSKPQSVNYGGRRKRNSGSRSSSDAREEALLIKQFVNQLVENACDIVMRDQSKQTSAEKSDEKTHHTTEEKSHKSNQEIELKHIEKSKQKLTEYKLEGVNNFDLDTYKKGAESQEQQQNNSGNKKENKNIHGNEVNQQSETKNDKTKLQQKALLKTSSSDKRKDNLTNPECKSQKSKKQEGQDSQNLQSKVKDPLDDEKGISKSDSLVTDAMKLKKKRVRQKNKKNDNEEALNNFMRQMAGDGSSETIAAPLKAQPQKNIAVKHQQPQTANQKPVTELVKTAIVVNKPNLQKVKTQNQEKQYKELEKVEPVPEKMVLTGRGRKGSQKSNRYKKPQTEHVTTIETVEMEMELTPKATPNSVILEPEIKQVSVEPPQNIINASIEDIFLAKTQSSQSQASGADENTAAQKDNANKKSFISNSNKNQENRQPSFEPTLSSQEDRQSLILEKFSSEEIEAFTPDIKQTKEVEIEFNQNKPQSFQSSELQQEGQERQNSKPFFKFDPQRKKQNMPWLQKFNQGQSNGDNQMCNERRNEPYETEYTQQDPKKYYGNNQWNQNNSNQTQVNRQQHGSFSGRQSYYGGYYNQQKNNFDYFKDKYEGQQNENFSQSSDFQANLEGIKNQEQTNQLKNVPLYNSQSTFGNYQGQNQYDQEYRHPYQKNRKFNQDTSVNDGLVLQSTFSSAEPKKYEENLKFQGLGQETGNPFVEKFSVSNFTPQQNADRRNSSHDNQQIQTNIFNVDGNRGSSQRSQDRNTTNKDFNDEELIKKNSLDFSKSVWSKQSTPFHPNDANQNWAQPGPQSPFVPINGTGQFSDSGFNSPVQIGPPTYVNFGNGQNQFGGENLIFNKLLDNIVRPIDTRQQVFQPRIPSQQYERYPQDFQVGTPIGQAIQRGQSTFNVQHQETIFEQFGIGLNNQRVHSYQSGYQNQTPVMHFITGVGDPISMFNNADPLQRLMESDPDYKYVEEQFYKEFDASIKSYIDGITQTVDQYKKERDIVFAKIQSIAKKVFENQNPVIQMFGSLVTGLALETSDMDMVVSGLNISDRQVMIDEMHNLADGLNTWDLVQDLKAIDTASIPVIKAKINLKVLRAKECGGITHESDHAEQDMLPIDITFDDSPSQAYQSTMKDKNNGPESFEQFSVNQVLLNPYGSQSPAGNNFNLDSFENFKFGFQNQTGVFGGLDALIPEEQHFVPPAYQQQQKTHLGLASCKLIKDYVNSYPYIREVAILLKLFLAVHDFNSAYLGGISSYSAVLLIVAYMNYFKLQNNPNLTPSRLLMGFLDFYSNCFDARKYGVKTINQMSYYPLPQSSSQMFVIMDPVNPSNNTARNSFRTPEVLKHFREAFRRLKSLIQQHYHVLKAQKGVQGKSSDQLVSNESKKSESLNIAQTKKEDVQTALEAKFTSQALLQLKEQPKPRDEEKFQQSNIFSKADFSVMTDTCIAPKDSQKFAKLLKDAEQSRLSSVKKGYSEDGQNASSNNKIKVFSSVDFVQKFLADSESRPEELL